MKGLKAATFNVNSIRARLPIVLDWIRRESPDLLCLQETKCQDKDFPAAQIEELGYHAVFRGQKSYNGVALISRRPAGEVRRDLYDEGDAEARFIRADVGDVAVLNVYVPQGVAVGTEKFAYKLRWMTDLLTHVRAEYDPGRPLLIAGDFNVALDPIDVHDPQAYQGEVCFHPDEQAILRELLDWGLVDLLRRHEPGGGHYTFWDYRIPNAMKRKMGWRIDYILTTKPLAERSRRVWIDTDARLLPKPSDHTFLVAEFD
ncbi:MAG: exodeoxyribonuclease III [Deltaproteobacteria bacterium]|nr:exodeoxyribonuclease III [Deltaproteobacteria bacterium]